jgi:hypothetical protein
VVGVLVQMVLDVLGVRFEFFHGSVLHLGFTSGE